MHVHFVGVSGTGMGSLAGLFKAAGHRVTGSDVAFHPPMGPALRAWGIELREGFSPAHLEPAPDLVVIGNVCRPDNPEARAAIDAGLRTTSMAHALAEHILEGTSPLVVGGTHGKTTTSAMVAWVLHQAGKAPGFLIGGLPKNFDESYRLPATAETGATGATSEGGARRLPIAPAQVASSASPSPEPPRKPPFVVEGDEYDTAFFEKTPKFWHYRPEVAIVTSIEHDHIDIYPDAASYDRAFSGFVDRIPPAGLVVASAHDPHVVETVTAAARAPVAWYALSGDDISVPPHWLAAPVGERGGAQHFDLFAGGVAAGRGSLRAMGLHNLRNALAAIGAACQGFGVPIASALGALATFDGVRRRQDLLFEVRGARVYDDFAHHPTAVKETLAALRARHPEGNLWAVFEPRSATACRSLHQIEYETAFAAADRVVLAPVGRPEIPAEERLDTSRIAEAIGPHAWAAPSVDAILERLAAEVRPGDTVALLSNGAFGGIHARLEAALAANGH